jgi:hypothetical protein
MLSNRLHSHLEKVDSDYRKNALGGAGTGEKDSAG